MVLNLSKKFTDDFDMQTDTLDSLIRHMEIRIIGHGIRSSGETLIQNFLFPSFLMVYFYKGSAELNYGGKTVLLEPGSFFMYKPFEVYSGVLKSKPPFVFSYVYFDIYPYSTRIDFERNAFQAEEKLFKLPWYSGVGALLDEFFQPESAKRIGCKTLLKQAVKGVAAHILCDQLNQPRAASFFIGSKESALIDQTFAYSERHLSEPINIGEIVKSLGTSRTTLDRVFKDIALISPIRAITRFKMQRSLSLMKAGNSVKQTAQALGYSSTFHFSAAFLSVMGKRPSSYIELMNQKRLRQKKAAFEIGDGCPAPGLAGGAL